MKVYNSIDLFKFLMSLFVIAIHTSGITHPLYDSIVSLAVPFFFIAMGFLTNDIKRKAISLFKMYLSWSIIYLPLALWHYASQKYGVIESINQYLKDFIFVGEHYNSWMLWYLLSAIYTLMFIMLVKNYIKDEIILLICFIITLVGVIITEYLSDTYIIQQTIRNGRIFTGFFYIMFGYCLRSKNSNKYINVILFFIGFITNIYFDGLLGKLALIISSIGLFGIVKEIQIKKDLRVLRLLSTDLYFIHLYVWSIIYMLLYNEKKFGIHMFLLTMFISLLLSYIYEKIHKKI